MIVTIATLKDAGYDVSNSKNEAAVALATANIKSAYFPETETFESVQSQNLLLALVFSLLLKRKTVLTRFGNAEKISQYTIAADKDQIRSEIRGYCRRPLESYLADKDFQIDDILEIYDNLIFI